MNFTFDSVRDIQVWLQATCTGVVGVVFCTPNVRGEGRSAITNTKVVANLLAGNLANQVNGVEEKVHEWQGARKKFH